MSNPSAIIQFTIQHYGDEYRISTYNGEYRDLKCLIMDHLFPEDFGQCGGMGRCATCMVQIEGITTVMDDLRRNEETTLNKAGVSDRGIRLACQLEVNDSLANVHIRILD